VKRIWIWIVLTLVALILIAASIYFYFQKEPTVQIKKEFDIQGLTWRTYSYYYNPFIYEQGYNFLSNKRILNKAKNTGANFLLIRAFYSGTPDGGLEGNTEKAQRVLKKAINEAHKKGFKIFLVPYVESREYWVNKKWRLSEDIWTETVLTWAKFAQENKVEMFAPGVEMNLILDEKISGRWLKEILPKIREIYSGKVVTAEHYDAERWKILDKSQSFFDYDCLGLTFYPRKEYDGVSDIRSFEDVRDYIEKEATTIDKLAKKYNISCKLAVPMGLDYWQGSAEHSPLPDAQIYAQAISIGLDILKEHNFSGVFIGHWADEDDHFGKRKDVREMLKKRWTEE